MKIQNIFDKVHTLVYYVRYNIGVKVEKKNG